MADHVIQQVGYHDHAEANINQAAQKAIQEVQRYQVEQLTYTFTNFFHPFIGELIAKLNRESLPGMLAGQLEPQQDFFKDLYSPNTAKDNPVQVECFPKEIDVSPHGPYANYNWELFFHIPLTIAVHLSKTQRFVEAQRWFHYIFDPTSNDQKFEPPMRFWKFLAFRKRDDKRDDNMTIDEIVRILSIPRSQLSQSDQDQQDDIMNGYNAIRNKPFQPHAVAQTRHLAYQYYVVMKYLDNLIAWGDHPVPAGYSGVHQRGNAALCVGGKHSWRAPAAHPAARVNKSQNLRATQEGGPRTDR